MIRHNKVEDRQVFFLIYFNDTISREEHKLIYMGLRITGIALSNYRRFSVSHCFFPNPTILEDDLQELG